jgi:hypothetical protein
MNAITMVHKMQRLAMNVSEVSDTSSLLPAAAGVPNRQKCATIVEEAEIDDFDGDDDHGQDNNGYDTEGRKTNSVCARVRVRVCLGMCVLACVGVLLPSDCQ